MKVGESVTLDNGRVVIHLLERTGRHASRIRFDMAPDVIVNKPGFVRAAHFAREGIRA
jgi:hypothetical protein